MNELLQGWLSPTGEFHKCNSFDHYEVARELAQCINAPSIDSKLSRIIPEDDRLLSVGWVYIGIATFKCHEWRIGWERKLTPEQIKFLRPYFENENGLPVNEFCKYRWEDEINT